jgi:hypothetical protein
MTRRFAKVYHDEIDALRSGDFTAPMLLTMTILRRWADWETGVAPYVSAKGLATFSRKVYSPRTFSDALRRLDLMGYITRLMKGRDHSDYPVVIHNFEVYGLVDGVTVKAVINPKETKTWKEVSESLCDDAAMMPAMIATTLNPTETKTWKEVSKPLCDDDCNESAMRLETRREVIREVKQRSKSENNSSAAAAAVADSLTGNPETGKPGDGWTAYAKAISGIPGAEAMLPVKPAPVYPVEPKPKRPVQPVEPPAEPKTSVTKSPPAPAAPPTGEAVRLAGMFSGFLGKAPSPADAKKFGGLLEDNPDLGDLLGFALTPRSRWAEKISSADHPFAYLKRVLEPLRDGLERIEQKKAQRPTPKPAPDEWDSNDKTDVRNWDLSGLED